MMFLYVTYSHTHSPCQSVSAAGLQEGLTKGSGTKSSLLWDCEQIIKIKRPKYLLMENVKMLLSKKFKSEFDTWCNTLEELGYSNYYKILNAKDYGMPQNRERVFMISIYQDEKGFEFPTPITLGNQLKDILCEDVDDKYIIDKEHAPRISKVLDKLNLDCKTITNNGEYKLIAYPLESREYNGFKKISPCLVARDYKDQKVVMEKNPRYNKD